MEREKHFPSDDSYIGARIYRCAVRRPRVSWSAGLFVIVIKESLIDGPSTGGLLRTRVSINQRGLTNVTATDRVALPIGSKPIEKGRKRTLSNQQLGLMLCLAIASCSWLKRNSTPRPRTALLNTITTRRAPKGLENVEQNKMVDHERRHGETMNYITLTFQKAAVAVQGMSREIKKSINTTSPFRGRKKSQTARNETTDKKSHGRVVF